MPALAWNSRECVSGGSVKLALGIVLAAAIGATCRFFDIPAPAPPKLLGACLVVAMTMGYMLTDQYLSARTTRNEPPKVERQASR
jgi:XapX domain-containing protein